MTQKHRSISLIVIHCSATRVTQDFTFEQLEACHLARGFKSIGYHYYITKDGVVYPGRPESEVGAHARHYNAHSTGEPMLQYTFTCLPSRVISFWPTILRISSRVSSCLAWRAFRESSVSSSGSRMSWPVSPTI